MTMPHTEMYYTVYVSHILYTVELRGTVELDANYLWVRSH